MGTQILYHVHKSLEILSQGKEMSAGKSSGTTEIIGLFFISQLLVSFQK